jgi:uncharacterized protein YerC
LQKRGKRGNIGSEGDEADQVAKLISEGETKAAVAQELGIGVASVCRVMRFQAG